MSAAPAPSSAVSTDGLHNHHSRGEPMKFPSNSTDAARDAGTFFIRMLWRAFPAPSEHALAARAAPVLDVSERQVRNWLRGTHTPRADYLLAVMAIAGAEVVIRKIEGD
ncbi:hypothetical protein [Palleronia sp. LCG004]|uniref:hypothetical protein n=1 Tax=Palleronia sp. LCG004 TaxID=3079304 RepID=UPI002942349B|nr:hypothetical protein [Palleronia sp. LCG004]WOI54974.1 hypothetical protein RVY76_07805 [Palleronia sp. LCG004]